MGVSMGQSYSERRVFRRGDNVLEHWIDHAEGFEVRQGVRGHVEAVDADPRGRAKALIVRSAVLRRRQVIPPEAVVAVDPFARRMTIARLRPPAIVRVSRSVARLIAAIAGGLAWIVAWSAPRVRRAWIAADEGVRRVVPRLRTGAIAAWALGSAFALGLGRSLAARARSAGAWLAPRLSAGAGTAWLLAVSGARTLSIHATAAGAWLRPRVSTLAREAFVRVVATTYVCLLGLAEASIWAVSRVRASTRELFPRGE
jgi:hypothetical protein